MSDGDESNRSEKNGRALTFVQQYIQRAVILSHRVLDVTAFERDLYAQNMFTPSFFSYNTIILCSKIDAVDVLTCVLCIFSIDQPADQWEDVGLRASKNEKRF